MNSIAPTVSVHTGGLSPVLRLSAFVAANLAMFVLIGCGIAISASPNPRMLYLILLTVLCSSPLLKLQRLNDAYFLLGVYLAVYFEFFGVADLMHILLGRTRDTEDGLLTAAECVILAAGLTLTLGYHAGVRWSHKRASSVLAKEWPFFNALTIGLIFWIAGTVSAAYWAVFIVNDRSNAALLKNLANLGPGLTMVSLLGQLVQPLGVLILAYVYAKYRKGYLLGLILGVVFIQIVLGFVADFKTEAMSAGILVIMTKTYVDGKLPKGWLLGGVMFIWLAFPVFQTLRTDLRGEHGVSSLQTLQNLTDTLQKALQAEDKVTAGFGGADYQVQSFWERASLKSSVELIVHRVGKDVPFQQGATLTPIAVAFIPKIIWPDKPSNAVGQVFNRLFHVSADPDTYISPSHVGELYWNFGWPGILLISPLLGALLGVIGARCCAVPQLSLTRLLIMVVTIFAFAIRSEGSIATDYVVWLRSMAVIGLLHWAFARRVPIRGAQEEGAGAAAVDASARPLNAAHERFPQLLR
jgi:hypothetical protein